MSNEAMGLLKWGVVQAIDPTGPSVRVWFEEDQLLSMWLPILQMATLGIRFFVVPAIGAQAAVLTDDRCEEGAVIGFRYSSADPPPVTLVSKVHMDMGDGTMLDYDTASHTLTALVSGPVNLEATQFSLTGPVKILGDLEVVGATSLLGDVEVTGDTDLIGAMDVAGAVSAVSFAVGETVLAVP